MRPLLAAIPLLALLIPPAIADSTAAYLTGAGPVTIQNGACVTTGQIVFHIDLDGLGLAEFLPNGLHCGGWLGAFVQGCESRVDGFVCDGEANETFSLSLDGVVHYENSQLEPFFQVDGRVPYHLVYVP